MIRSYNPFSATIIKEFKPLSSEQIESKLQLSQQALKTIRQIDVHTRSGLMNQAAKILEENKQEYAEMATREMGKLITESISEIEKCAWVCRFYAEKGPGYLLDTIVESDASLSKIVYTPLGTILAVMPWNFPFWQVFRFAAPSLMAGNTALLKHASNVPQCAMIIQEVFSKAGWPEGSFQSLLIKSNQVDAIIEDTRIKAVTLTGSGSAGRAVASKAAQHLKKSVLELGGSDPYIILKDADINDAASICAKGRMLNAGQSCIGAKRFIVVQEIYEDFLTAFRKEMETYIPGDPMMPDTNLAPMASKELRDELHEQVLKSITAGCHLLTGGYISPDLPDTFYPPTILTEIQPSSPAYQEELFGPVASVIRVKNEDEAIQIANDTEFGLGAAIFSRNVIHAEELAKNKIEAGCCFINAQVKSDPRLPFGGIKNSGYGRELSKEGLMEFVNVKTIYRK